MKEIPHPFITESIERFHSLPGKERVKIYFIHMNHTNPVLKITSQERKKVLEAGFNIAAEKEKFAL